MRHHAKVNYFKSRINVKSDYTFLSRLEGGALCCSDSGESSSKLSHTSEINEKINTSISIIIIVVVYCNWFLLNWKICFFTLRYT